MNDSAILKLTKNFLEYKNIDADIESVLNLKKESNTVGKIYQLNPDGFIATSNDDDITPVMAYSFNNKFITDENNLIQTMLQNDISKRKKYIENHSEIARQNNQLWFNYLNKLYPTKDPQQWPPAGTTSTDGWVETTWYQSGIYNQFCPLDDSGQRSVVGCVATAQAMIIDFHEYIGGATFDDSDDYYSGWGWSLRIDDDHEERDFPAFPVLNEYLEEVEEHYNNNIPLTNQDKAALSFACGVSVEMSYSSDGSGAWTAEVANSLLDKFGFISAQYYENYGYNFYNNLSTNMIEMRPAEMSIYDSNGESGHAIICDGYNTDDYYHLNFGWGTSNQTCWYTLPEGMPSGYSIISGAVMDIEGGAIPIDVQGLVNADGISPVGTEITLEGDRYYQAFVDEDNGSFSIASVLEGYYTATAILENKVYYESKEIYIDDGNSFIEFNLGNYEAITGNVSGLQEIDVCRLNLYQNDELQYSGLTDNNGDYSIPDVLPGIYTVTISADGNYYTSDNINVELDNMNFDFELEEYPADFAIGHNNAPAGIWSLIEDYTLSCAVKLTEAELAEFENDMLAKIKFKSPINDSDGEINVRVWDGNQLISENEVSDFNMGNWITADLESFIPINPDKEYYIGYEIHTTNSNLVYHDAGPRVEGKGAFFRTNGWVELPAATNDFNFCIEAGIISQNYAEINGSVELNDGEGEVPDVTIQANNFRAHPQDNGSYNMMLKEGVYDMVASLADYADDVVNDVSIIQGETLSNIDFDLNYNVSVPGNNIANTTALFGNYPNPFNPSTKISFNIEQTAPVKLVIYNIKGEKINTLIDNRLAAGNHRVVWNGLDKFGKKASSGVYLYKLSTEKYTSTKKMILMK